MIHEDKEEDLFPIADMRAHLYTISLNEVDMLGFFFRHYDPWVDRYVFFDDGSTDATLEMLRAHPRVEVRKFERTHPDSFVESHREMHDHAWKESRGQAEWVVITAVDEHLHHPHMEMLDYLDLCAAKGTTCMPALGYQMVDEEFPAPTEWLCQTRVRGMPWPLMSKLSIFDPHAVEETHFGVGRHFAQPVGRIQYPASDEVLLLHYKHLDRRRTLQRHQFLQNGLREVDLRNGWGSRYSWSEQQFNTYWDDLTARSVDVMKHDVETQGVPLSSRFWRQRLEPQS